MSEMNSFLLSGIIGAILALLNFFSSTLYSSKILTVSKVTSVALVLGGFIVRLTILGLVFYFLSTVKAIHLQTALLSFVICFTLCLILKTMVFYRKITFLKKNSTGM